MEPHEHPHDHTHAQPHHHPRPVQAVASSPLPSGALLAWALFALIGLALVASGAISTFIKGFWHPFFALACLIILAASSYAYLHNQLARPARNTRGWVTLLLPSVILLCCAPAPLASSMLANTHTASTGATQRMATANTSDGHIAFPALSDTTPTPLTLEELSDRFNFGVKEELYGKPITLIGFIATSTGSGTTPEENQALISRFKIYCCAADAIAYTALIDGVEQPLREDTWVEVTGHIDRELTEARADNLPVLTPTSITTIRAPKVPYL